MPIIEVYNLEQKLTQTDYEMIAMKISGILGIPSKNVWIIQQQSTNTYIFKGKEYDQRAPIIFFNLKKKHLQEKLIKAQQEFAHEIAVIAKCRPEEVFCGVRRIADEEVLFLSLA